MSTGRPRKHIFTEEEKKNPVIDKYIKHCEKQKIYAREKQKKNLTEKSDKFFNNKMSEEEEKNFKIIIRKNLFKNKK